MERALLIFAVKTGSGAPIAGGGPSQPAVPSQRTRRRRVAAMQQRCGDRKMRIASVLAAGLVMAGCTATTRIWPVEVTRFHVFQVGRGTIAIEPDLIDVEA